MKKYREPNRSIISILILDTIFLVSLEKSLELTNLNQKHFSTTLEVTHSPD